MTARDERLAKFYAVVIGVLSVGAAAWAFAAIAVPQTPLTILHFDDKGTRPVQILEIQKSPVIVQAIASRYVATSPVLEPAWKRVTTNIEDKAVWDHRVGDPGMAAYGARAAFDIDRDLANTWLVLYQGTSPVFIRTGTKRRPIDTVMDYIRFASTMSIVVIAMSMILRTPQYRVALLAAGLVLFSISAFPPDVEFTRQMGWLSSSSQLLLAEVLKRVLYPITVFGAIYLIGAFVLAFSGKDNDHQAGVVARVGLTVGVMLALAFCILDTTDFKIPNQILAWNAVTIIAIIFNLAWPTVCYYVSRRLCVEVSAPRGVMHGLKRAFGFILFGIACENLFFVVYSRPGNYESEGLNVVYTALGVLYVLLPLGTCYVLSRGGLIKLASPGLIAVGASTAIGIAARFVEEHFSSQIRNLGDATGGRVTGSTLIVAFIALLALPGAQKMLSGFLDDWLKDPMSEKELTGLGKRLGFGTSLNVFAAETIAYVRRITEGDSALFAYLEASDNPAYIAGSGAVLTAENCESIRQDLRRIGDNRAEVAEVKLRDGTLARVVPIRDSGDSLFGFIVYIWELSPWLDKPSEGLPTAVLDVLGGSLAKQAYLECFDGLRSLLLVEGKIPEALGFVRIASSGIVLRRRGATQ